MRFIDTKSETLDLRVSPIFKKVLKEVADHKQRSMANILEVFLDDHCAVATGKKATPTAHKWSSTDRRAYMGTLA